MSRIKFFFALFGGIIYVVSACSNGNSPASAGGGGTEPPSNVSFSSDVQPIFASAGCAVSSCHGSSKSAGLSLTPSEAYDNLVNIPSTEMGSLKRVLPDDAENSYLIIKLEGRQTVGGRMPLTGGALSTRNIQIIRTWIDEGAKNN